MIPDQELPKATKLGAGKTYFHIGSDWKAVLLTPRLDATPFHNAAYYGPIDTTPSVIDLSHFDLSKIEAKRKPDKPGLWHMSKSRDSFEAIISAAQSEIKERSFWPATEYRFLCEFIQPRQSPVIPPLPTVKLYAVEQAGVVKWCHKSKYGFWTADGLHSFADPDAVPIAEKVVTVTE